MKKIIATISLVLAFVAMCSTATCHMSKADDTNEVYDVKQQVTTKENYVVEEHVVEVEIKTSEVDLIAKTLWGECRGLSTFEQSMVVWNILNRVDDERFPNTIEGVVTQKYQYSGYKSSHPVTEELKALTEDVLTRWKIEKMCVGDVGRTLPSDYLWFRGDGKHNYFRNKYSGDYTTWNWDCYNPYN